MRVFVLKVAAKTFKKALGIVDHRDFEHLLEIRLIYEEQLLVCFLLCDGLLEDAPGLSSVMSFEYAGAVATDS